MAEGYQNGVSKPYGFEYVGVAPAGSLSASGDDMGRFMIAHLANGGPLLKPATAQLMHATANEPIPGAQKMSLGFYQSNINGHPVVSHGGDTVAFHSDLHLFLNDGVGLYVSFNSGGREGAAHALRGALFEEFADRYFPAPADTRKLDDKTARANAEKLAGTWSTSRRSFSSFISIADLISQTKVSVGENGEPVVGGGIFNGLGGQPPKWVATGPMQWRDPDSHETLVAKVVDGEAVRFSLGNIAPIIVWDRTPWYQNSTWLLPLLYLSLAVLFADGRLLAGPRGRAEALRRHARPRRPRAEGLSLQPHRGARDPRHADRLGVRHLRDVQRSQPAQRQLPAGGHHAAGHHDRRLHRRFRGDALVRLDGLEARRRLQGDVEGEAVERLAGAVGLHGPVGGLHLPPDRHRDELLMGQTLAYRVETHPLAAPFRISGYVFEASDLVVVELDDGQHRGRGEAGGVYYMGDEAPQIVEALEANRASDRGLRQPGGIAPTPTCRRSP